MRERLVTTKVSPTALRLIRMIAAVTGDRQYAALERVLEAEARRLGIKVGG